MITVSEPIRVLILNQPTGQRFDLIPASDLTPDSGTVGRITTICNEPGVYDWLFRDLL